MPRKTFTAGEVLAAADVNTFLMDQSVMTFADSDARDLAIPTPSEGMVTYLDDTNALEVFDGSSFVPAAPATNAGLEHILTRSVSAITTESFNDVFSAEYDNYLCIYQGVNSSSGAGTIRLRASGTDNSDNQYTRQFFTVQDTVFAGGRVTATSFGLGGIDNIDDTEMWHFFNPFLAKATRWHTDKTNGPIASYFFTSAAGVHNVAASFDGFSFAVAAGDFTGSFSIYGYRKS